MSKEFEEEVLSPGCEPHFSGDRAGIGMRTQDVEAHSSDNPKILWSVILAGSGIVLVEDDIELPMELVLDTPMHARYIEHPAGRETLRQHNVARLPFDGAAPTGPLGLDPRERRQV